VEQFIYQIIENRFYSTDRGHLRATLAGKTILFNEGRWLDRVLARALSRPWQIAIYNLVTVGGITDPNMVWTDNESHIE